MQEAGTSVNRLARADLGLNWCGCPHRGAAWGGGSMLLSASLPDAVGKLSVEDTKILQLDSSEALRKMPGKLKEYMEFHREHVFKKG